jgi:uncharacterized membrane protein YhaH (DUF805 family)
VNPALSRIAKKVGLTGRTKRTSILLYIVAPILIWILLWLAGDIAGPGRRGAALSPEAAAAIAAAAPWISSAWSLLFLWLAWRRFQDHDRPGWLALVPTAYAYALWLPPLRLLVLLPELAALVGLVLLLALLVGLFLPPTVGPNRYGPDPRGWRSPEHLAEERRQGRAT